MDNGDWFLKRAERARQDARKTEPRSSGGGPLLFNTHIGAAPSTDEVRRALRIPVPERLKGRAATLRPKVWTTDPDPESMPLASYVNRCDNNDHHVMTWEGWDVLSKVEAPMTSRQSAAVLIPYGRSGDVDQAVWDSYDHGNTMFDVFPSLGVGSGTMITPWHVLTAAHVVHRMASMFAGALDYPDVVVCLGGNSSNLDGECRRVLDNHTPVEGARITIHPGYDGQPSDDLAIICLPRAFYQEHGMMCLTNRDTLDEIEGEGYRNLGYPADRQDCSGDTLLQDDEVADPFVGVPLRKLDAPEDQGQLQGGGGLGGGIGVPQVDRLWPKAYDDNGAGLKVEGGAFIGGQSGGPMYHCGDCNEDDHGFVVGVFSQWGNQTGKVASVGHRKQWLIDHLDGLVDDQCWNGEIMEGAADPLPNWWPDYFGIAAHTQRDHSDRGGPQS